MKLRSPKPRRRTYRQGARAEAAEATGERILDAFLAHVSSQWVEQITLDAVARDAEVTVQTVVRRFGGKEGLLLAVNDRMHREVRRRRQVEPGDVAGAVDVLQNDYEATGDLVMRLLAQEERYPALKPLLDSGRAGHRTWVGEAFAPSLAGLSTRAQTARLDALVVATDVYVWKLLRRDMARPPDAYKLIVADMIRAALQNGEENFNPKKKNPL